MVIENQPGARVSLLLRKTKQTAHERRVYCNFVFSDALKAGLCTLAACCHLEISAGPVNMKSGAFISLVFGGFFFCVHFGWKNYTAMTGDHNERQAGGAQKAWGLAAGPWVSGLAPQLLVSITECLSKTVSGGLTNSLIFVHLNQHLFDTS